MNLSNLVAGMNRKELTLMELLEMWIYLLAYFEILLVIDRINGLS